MLTSENSVNTKFAECDNHALRRTAHSLELIEGRDPPIAVSPGPTSERRFLESVACTVGRRGGRRLPLWSSRNLRCCTSLFIKALKARSRELRQGELPRTPLPRTP